MEQNKPKAKRKLKSLDFSGEDAAVALVGPCVGGPANQIPTLVIKAATQFSDEFLEKMSKVRVEMDIVDYLTRFYGIWYEDAEVLARALGFTTKEMESEDNKVEYNNDWYEDYIKQKVDSIEIMKQLYEAENMTDVLANLSEEQYLQFLVDQQNIEKAFKKMDAEKENKSKAKPKVKTKVVEKESTEVAKATEGDTSPISGETVAQAASSTNVDVEKSEGTKPSVVKQSNKETKPMTEKTVHVTEKEVELVEKSQFDDIQKAFNETQVELKKALEEIEKYRIEKAAAIAKARKEQLTKACGKHAEVIFKAIGECEEETFVEVVKALSEMQELIEKSALFQEQGASVSDVDSGEDSAVAKLLKAKFQSK